MARLQWDAAGEKLYETGVKNGVLYPQSSDGSYPTGVAWNGLTQVDENPTGGEANPLYANDEEYINLMSKEKWEGTIQAYTYPEEFEPCNGLDELTDGVYIGQQERKPFGFAYVTTIGNDTEGTKHGYKIHVVYGCKASPSQETHSTINDNPEAVEMSWGVTATPIKISENKSTATVIINSTKLTSAQMTAIENVLWGSESGSGSSAGPRLPLPAEIKTIIDGAKA